jgi:hypothetical protein
MFGKKTKRIAQLEAELVRLQGDVERYSPLVADFTQRVNAEVENVESLLPIDIDLILGTAEAEYRKQRFKELFESLPLEKRVNLLLNNLPAQAQELLLHETIANELERANAYVDLETLLDRSRDELRLDLSLVPLDSVVDISLNLSSDFDENVKPKFITKESEPYIEIKAVHKGNGIYAIIAIDKIYEYQQLQVRPLIEGSIFNLGMLIGNAIEPTIYFESSLYACTPGKGAYKVEYSDKPYAELLVSRVLIDGKDAFFGTKKSK